MKEWPNDKSKTMSFGTELRTLISQNVRCEDKSRIDEDCPILVKRTRVKPRD